MEFILYAFVQGAAKRISQWSVKCEIDALSILYGASQGRHIRKSLRLLVRVPWFIHLRLTIPRHKDLRREAAKIMSTWTSKGLEDSAQPQLDRAKDERCFS